MAFTINITLTESQEVRDLTLGERFLEGDFIGVFSGPLEA